MRHSDEELFLSGENKFATPQSKLTFMRNSHHISFARGSRNTYVLSETSALMGKSIKRETEVLMNLVKTSEYLGSWEMNDEPMGYRDMNKFYYYIATLSLFAI